MIRRWIDAELGLVRRVQHLTRMLKPELIYMGMLEKSVCVCTWVRGRITALTSCCCSHTFQSCFSVTRQTKSFKLGHRCWFSLGLKIQWRHQSHIQQVLLKESILLLLFSRGHTLNLCVHVNSKHPQFSGCRRVFVGCTIFKLSRNS